MSVIKNACYYILFNNREAGIHKAVIYDVNGNPLREILLLLSEYYYSSCPRIEDDGSFLCWKVAALLKLLSDITLNLEGQFTIMTKIIISLPPNRMMALDLGGLVYHQLHVKNHESSIKVDYDWMLSIMFPLLTPILGETGVLFFK